MPKFQGPSLMARALNFLSRREHSEQELRKKLLPYVESPSDLEEVIDKLKKNKWQSDERFVDSYVRQRSQKFGAQKVIDELRQRGIEGEVVQHLRDALGATEQLRAWQVWSKRYSEIPTNPKERAKQVRYLVSRGFSLDLAIRITSGRYRPSDEDSSNEA